MIEECVGHPDIRRHGCQALLLIGSVITLGLSPKVGGGQAQAQTHRVLAVPVESAVIEDVAGRRGLGPGEFQSILDLEVDRIPRRRAACRT